ncbi:HlyD family secretion protein [Bacillus sp. OV194]|nr:HlyD family secretion protein [Bacillus sp. OV194]
MGAHIVNKKIIFLGIGVFSVLLLALNGWIFSKDKSAFARVQNVHLASANVMDIKRTVMTKGVVVPAENETFYVQDKLGYVKEMEVKAGDEVTPGTVLFTYENPELEKEVRSLEQKKEETAVKETYYKDLQTKLQAQADALGTDKKEETKKNQLEKDQAKAKMESELAAARNSSIDEQLTKLAEEKENLSIKSNTQGVVKSVNQGASEGSMPIVEIVSKDDVQIKGNLTEEDSLIIEAGEKAVILSPAIEDKQWKGTVSQFQDAKKSNEGSAFPFTVKMDQANNLKIGQHLQLKLKPVIREKAVVIPMSSLIKSKGKPFVYTVQEGYLKKRAVRTGLSYGKWIEIKAGIRPEEKVVSDPTSYLTENTEVNVPKAKKAKDSKKDAPH